MKLLIPIATTLFVAACANGMSGSRTYESARLQPSAEVRESQNRLQTLGFYNGSPDGLWGPETRTAVQRFQQSRGLPVTAKLDDATVGALRNANLAPITLNDPTDVRTVQNRLRQLNFFSQPADGIWGSSTQVALENFQRARGLPVGQMNAATITALGLNVSDFPARPATSAAAPATGGVAAGDVRSASTLDRNVIRSIQQRLRQQGFLSAASDGVWGPRTQNALVRFQQSRGIEPNGQLTPATISALGLNPNNLAESASAPPAIR